MDRISPERNADKAWTVCEEEDGWYWYNDQGHPYGPHDTEEQADQCLWDYDATYYD